MLHSLKAQYRTLLIHGNTKSHTQKNIDGKFYQRFSKKNVYLKFHSSCSFQTASFIDLYAKCNHSNFIRFDNLID